MAPIDYSRWDNIDSESEGEVVADSTRIHSRVPPMEDKATSPPPRVVEPSLEFADEIDEAEDKLEPTEEEAESCRPAVELLFDAMMKRKKKGKKNSKLIWYLESAVEEAHKLALTHFPPPTPPTRSSCNSDKLPSSRSSGLSDLRCFYNIDSKPNCRMEDLPEIQLMPRSPEKQDAFVCERETLQKYMRHLKETLKKKTERDTGEVPVETEEGSNMAESTKADVADESVPPTGDVGEPSVVDNDVVPIVDGGDATVLNSDELPGVWKADSSAVEEAESSERMSDEGSTRKEGQTIPVHDKEETGIADEAGSSSLLDGNRAEVSGMTAGESSECTASEMSASAEVSELPRVGENAAALEGSNHRLTYEDIRGRNFSPSGLVTEPERVETQYENEEQLEELYFSLKAGKGLESAITLATFFKLFDVWIGLYRLRKCQKELDEILPVCRKLGDPFKLKAVQACAFTRWKQGNLTEALALFKEIEEMLGKSPALCENIGHTHSSMGNLEEAEQYFKEALSLIEQQVAEGRGTESDSNLGGVFLGLGIVLERRGRNEEALEFCKKAHKFYSEKFLAVGGSSLVAKAAMSVAKCYVDLNNLAEAQEYAEEAIEIFKRTCGDDSPLVASSTHTLGKILWRRKNREKARENFERAYALEAVKDAVDICVLMEVHNELIETHTEGVENVNRLAFRKYIPIVEAATRNIEENVVQDGNAAVYYKLAAEMYLWGGMYGECVRMVKKAIPLFKDEQSMDCSSFVNACERMLVYAGNNVTLGVVVDNFRTPAPIQGSSISHSDSDTAPGSEVVVLNTRQQHREVAGSATGEVPSSRESEEFFDCEEDML